MNSCYVSLTIILSTIDNGLWREGMSKGSKPRPIPNKDKYRSEWDRIFKKKEKEGDEQSKCV